MEIDVLISCQSKDFLVCGSNNSGRVVCCVGLERIRTSGKNSLWIDFFVWGVGYGNPLGSIPHSGR